MSPARGQHEYPWLSLFYDGFRSKTCSNDLDHADLNALDIYLAESETFVAAASMELIERGFPRAQLAAAIV